MGLGDLFGIVNKVMSLFNFDRKARRRNQIAKLEKELDELLAKKWSIKDARRIDDLRKRLKLLKTQAQND